MTKHAPRDAQRDLSLANITSAGDTTARARRFVLVRHQDISGVSGEGHVADGVLWPDGTASIRWRGEHPSVVHWDRGRVSVEFVHGHGGATEIRWLDDADGEPTTPAGPLPLRRAVDIALGANPPCPQCGRTIACPCGVSRQEGYVDAVLAAVRPWLRADDQGEAAS